MYIPLYIYIYIVLNHRLQEELDDGEGDPWPHLSSLHEHLHELQGCHHRILPTMPILAHLHGCTMHPPQHPWFHQVSHLQVYKYILYILVVMMTRNSNRWSRNAKHLSVTSLSTTSRIYVTQPPKSYDSFITPTRIASWRMISFYPFCTLCCSSIRRSRSIAKWNEVLYTNIVRHPNDLHQHLPTNPGHHGTQSNLRERQPRTIHQVLRSILNVFHICA